MRLQHLSCALAAVPVLRAIAATSSSRRTLLLDRQSVETSSDDTASTTTTADLLPPSDLTSFTSAVVANLSLLNDLPFPFEGRIGFNNATLFNLTLPTISSSSNYSSSEPTVEAVQAELEKNAKATVVAYEESFLEVAGNVTVEKVFEGGDYHEAPVYLPTLHQIFLTPSSGTTQHLIDLNTSTLLNFTASPPVENINGGTYSNGTLFVTTNGGEGTNPAVVAIEVETGESRVVVDNYFGMGLNSLNDIVADSQGNLIFNDATYGYLNGANPRPPKMLTATYLYNATSRLVKVLVDQIDEPNGVTLSPDGATLYVSDTGASTSKGTPSLAGPRTIYAFDLAGSFASNRRVFHRNPAGIPDGMKVDSTGHLWSVFGDADTGGIEVISPSGFLSGVIQLPFGGQATNLVFVPVEGQEGDDLWVVGGDAVWRVRGLNVTGVRVE